MATSNIFTQILYTSIRNTLSHVVIYKLVSGFLPCLAVCVCISKYPVYSHLENMQHVPELSLSPYSYQSSEKAKIQAEGVCQPCWEVSAGRQVSFAVFSSTLTGLITNLVIFVISYFK